MTTQIYSTTANASNVAYLFSGREMYSPSWLLGIKKNDQSTAPNAKEFPLATYGSTLSFHGYNATSTTTLTTGAVWTHVVVAGTLKGKGIYTSVVVTLSTTSLTFGTIASTTAIFTNTTYCTSGVCLVSAPTGGIAQFKGLT